MKIRILYNHVGCETAMKLANELRKNVNEDITAVEDVGDTRADLLIRWGCTNPVRYEPRSVLNNKESVAKTSHKLDMLELFYNNNITVPAHTSSMDTALTLKKPLLGRRINHTRGKDIVLCLENNDVRSSDSNFWISFIPTKYELRVYMFKGEILCVMKKEFEELDDKYRWESEWTTRVFETENRELLSNIKSESLRAIETLRLDFGAADVIVDDNNKVFVLEVNSAPQLWGVALNKLKSKFIEHIESVRRNG